MIAQRFWLITRRRWRERERKRKAKRMAAVAWLFFLGASCFWVGAAINLWLTLKGGA